MSGQPVQSDRKMLQFSDDYNAQTIFDQVWEAPYEWFDYKGGDTKLPATVCEVDYPDGFAPEVVREYIVTAEMIEAATIRLWVEYQSQRNGSWFRTMADYLEDLDADDVDAILQLACFGEIRYG